MNLMAQPPPAGQRPNVAVGLAILLLMLLAEEKPKRLKRFRELLDDKAIHAKVKRLRGERTSAEWDLLFAVTKEVGEPVLQMIEEMLSERPPKRRKQK
jgi:hypothetical protein